jgi:hypothetical protein
MSIRTELLGKGAVEDIICRSKIVLPYIEQNDKSPIWDGNLFVYKEPNKGKYDNKKRDLNNTIPVQVKGISVKKLSMKIASHSFDIDDLAAYYRNGGVILFVAEIDDDYNKRVFYVSLLPYDIKVIVGDFENSAGEIKVDLKHLDTSMINEFEDTCENFILNRELQFSTKMFQLPIEKAKQLIITSTLRHSSFEDYLLNNSVFLYGKGSENDIIPLLVDKIDISEIEKQIIRTVSINEKKYFDTYKVIHKKENVELVFDDNLVFTLQKEKLCINYKFHAVLEKQFNCIEFIMRFIENRGFSLSNHPINLISGDINSDEHEQIHNYYKYLRNTAALLDLFGVNYCELNLDSITDKGQKNLNLLINTMVFGNDFPRIDNIPAKFRFDIANLSLLTVIYKNSNGKVIIEDFASLRSKRLTAIPKCEAGKENREHYDVSPFIILNMEDIISSTNINPYMIKKSIQDIEYTEGYGNSVVMLLLEMIKAYDKTKDNEYLDVSLEICLWLKEHDPNNPIHLINEYQIYSRQRELLQKEIKVLHDMVEMQKDYSEYILLLCAIDILLKDIVAFEKHFNEISEEQREMFIGYPIYMLYKKLKEETPNHI